MNKRNGFTFVELLVVVSILGILSIISISAYGSYLKGSRDAKRRADLRIIQSALEKYHTDQGFYPCTEVGAGSCTNSLILENTALLTSETGRIPSPTAPVKYYLSSIPKPPGGSYYYLPLPDNCDNNTGKKCTKYCLYAFLEKLPGAAAGGCPDKNPTYNFAAASPD